LAFLALVLPGFLSIRVFGLLFPLENRALKDSLFEALAFSVINAALMSWAIYLIAQTNSLVAIAALSFATFLVAPVAWPFLLRAILLRLADKNVIMRMHKNAWDDLFARRQPLWLIVHLKDGRKLAGFFGSRSYAGLSPNSGHLYIEQLWKLDEDGRFLNPVERSAGIVLRPDDYHFVEAFSLEDEKVRPDVTEPATSLSSAIASSADDH
jgi:hypothetical protein